MSDDIIYGVKGFDRNMQCRGFQFEKGKEYECSGEIKCCSNGFHFCENPIDVFDYYAPASSVFHEVEGYGQSDRQYSDSKVAVSRLRVKCEISLPKLIGTGVKFILDKVDWKNKKEYNTGYRSAATNTGDHSAATNTGNQSAATNTGDHSAATNTGDHSAATNTGNRSAATNTGDHSAATNTGDHSAATNTGYHSAATNTGYHSAASVSGKESIAIATGYGSKAKGSIGCWLVLAEWDCIDGEYHIINVKSRKVDGKHIKVNTWYKMENNRFVEAA